jgi:hypothetical protein
LKIFQFIYKIGYASKHQSCWNTILTTTLANLNVVKGFVVQAQASLFSPAIQRCKSKVGQKRQKPVFLMAKNKLVE